MTAGRRSHHSSLRGVFAQGGHCALLCAVRQDRTEFARELLDKGFDIASTDKARAAAMDDAGPCLAHIWRRLSGSSRRLSSGFLAYFAPLATDAATPRPPPLLPFICRLSPGSRHWPWPRFTATCPAPRRWLSAGLPLNSKTRCEASGMNEACFRSLRDLPLLFITSPESGLLALLQHGCTPLHLAVRSGETRVVSFLIEKKASIDTCDKARGELEDMQGTLG